TSSHLVYITLNTGMGAGFVIGGELYRGAGGAHPEFAHQSVDPRSPMPAVRCACGADNCLETLVSGNGIRRRYGRAAESLAPQEWDEVAFLFGQGLRNIATLTACDAIAVGGGVAIGGGQRFLDAAVQVMRDCLKLVPPPRVYLSRLG